MSINGAESIFGAVLHGSAAIRGTGATAGRPAGFN